AWSLDVGFRLVGRYRLCVAAVTVADPTDPGTCWSVISDLDSEYAWRMVKFYHSYGMGGAKRILLDAARLRPSMATSWPDFSTYCRLNSGLYSKSKDEGGFGENPVRWVELVNDVFALGEPYGLTVEQA